MIILFFYFSPVQTREGILLGKVLAFVLLHPHFALLHSRTGRIITVIGVGVGIGMQLAAGGFVAIGAESKTVFDFILTYVLEEVVPFFRYNKNADIDTYRINISVLVWCER